MARAAHSSRSSGRGQAERVELIGAPAYGNRYPRSAFTTSPLCEVLYQLSYVGGMRPILGAQHVPAASPKNGRPLTAPAHRPGVAELGQLALNREQPVKQRITGAAPFLHERPREGHRGPRDGAVDRVAHRGVVHVLRE